MSQNKYSTFRQRMKNRKRPLRSIFSFWMDEKNRPADWRDGVLGTVGVIEVEDEHTHIVSTHLHEEEK